MNEPVVTISEPSLKSKKFEDRVRVIRIFNPDQERMISTLRYILSLPRHSNNKTVNDQSNRAVNE